MTRDPDETITILMDTKQRKPACVLIQAGAGGDCAALGELFDSKLWLTFPTDDMALLTASYSRWEKLAESIRVIHGE